MGIDAINGQQIISAVDFKIQANAVVATQQPAVQQAAAKPGDTKASTDTAATPGDLAQAVSTMNQMAQKLTTNLSFTVDNSTGMTVVKVMEADTQTVIRQIPSDEVLHIARALDTFQGLIIRNRA